MDSYEKIRKMGEISEQLKKHGLVQDSDEALKKAEDIMKDQGDQFYVPRDKLEEMKTKKIEPQDSPSNDSNLKYLNDRLNSVEMQFSFVRDKVNEIIAKINEIESKLLNREKQEIQATLVKKNEVVKEEIKESNTPKVVPEVKKEYNPSDVSVDKMFYVGKK